MKRTTKKPSRACSTADLARVTGGGEDSRNIELEMIKNIIQKPQTP